LLSQQGVQIRAMIIDNASTDQTPEIARELVSQDPRVEYRRHAVNQGHIASFNEGLDWATAKYTVVLPADDLLAPGALSRAVRFLDAHPEVGMCFGEHVEWCGEGQFHAPSRGEDCPWQIISGAAFIETTYVTQSCLPQMCTAVVRTEVQRRLGGYRPELPHAGDMEMWLRFAADGPLGQLNCIQGAFRRHAQNVSRQYYADRGLGDAVQRRLVFRLFFEKHRQRIEGLQRLESLAMREMAVQAFWRASHLFEQGDRAACNRHLCFARETCPELVSWPPWSRLRWKRLAGPRLWALLRPLVNRFRGRAPQESTALS